MKKILILGGSSDIGKALVKKLINVSNFIIHIHHNNSKIDKLLSKNSKIIKADLSKINEKNVSKKFNNDYDIIVNLIGYISNSSFTNFKIAELNKTIFINSLAPILIIRNNLDYMIKNKYGRIVNTSSVGVKFGGGTNTFNYSLSKHINEFIPSYIRNLCSKNILYNTLRIGVTNTKFHKKINNKSMNKRIKLIPIKKYATTDDIADYIYFLIDKNNYTTNEIINITGGE